jgi:uncharacterized membrane protein YdjX (TVP38/TMEM64 family)
MGGEVSGSPAAGASGRPSAAKLLIGAVAVVLLYLLAREAGSYVPEVAAWVETLGFWGPLAFIAIYAVAVVGFVPGALLTLAGGAIFDLVSGTLYVFTAAVLGSTMAFLVARYVARQAIEKRIDENPKFASIDRAVGEQGLKIMFLLRLSPAFPFSFLNYALGLTRVSLRDYLLASFGMIPGTVLYVYYGKLIGDVAALAGGAAPDKDAAYYAVLGVGLVATVVVTALVTRVASRALKQATAA